MNKHFQDHPDNWIIEGDDLISYDPKTHLVSGKGKAGMGVLTIRFKNAPDPKHVTKKKLQVHDASSYSSDLYTCQKNLLALGPYTEECAFYQDAPIPKTVEFKN